MTTNPILDPDMNTLELIKKNEDAEARKGARVMHFGAFRTDEERLRSAMKSVEYVDNKPIPKPEH